MPSPGPRRRLISPDDRPRARATPPARRLRPGRGRPVVPALHRARPRRRRQVAAGAASSSATWRAGPWSRAGAAFPTARGSPSGRCWRSSRKRSGSRTATRPKQARAKLAARAGRRGRTRELVAQQVAELIGLAEHGGSVEEGFEAVRAFFEALARSRTARARLRRHPLGRGNLPRPRRAPRRRRRADAPILLVCLARPELLDVRPGWGGGKLNATSALLEPLSDDECARLIENLVGQAELAGRGREPASPRRPRATRSSSRRCSRC